MKNLTNLSAIPSALLEIFKTNEVNVTDLAREGVGITYNSLRRRLLNGRILLSEIDQISDYLGLEIKVIIEEKTFRAGESLINNSVSIIENKDKKIIELLEKIVELPKYSLKDRLKSSKPFVRRYPGGRSAESS